MRLEAKNNYTIKKALENSINVKRQIEGKA
jgi:hypothetical protein